MIRFYQCPFNMGVGGKKFHKYQRRIHPLVSLQSYFKTTATWQAKITHMHAHGYGLLCSFVRAGEEANYWICDETTSD